MKNLPFEAVGLKHIIIEFVSGNTIRAGESEARSLPLELHRRRFRN